MTGVIDQSFIGRVLRASTVGYTCGIRSSDMVLPAFGMFVTTRHDSDGVTDDVIGLIYGIRIDDDPLVRQLIMANGINPATLRDQRENRMVPVEISVVNIGFQSNGSTYQNLPPRPPFSLDSVYMCPDDVIHTFTANLDFFRLVLNAPEVPTEELLAAALRYAAAARPPHDQREFLVAAGRKLAYLLGHDLARLNHLLRLIRPT